MQQKKNYFQLYFLFAFLGLGIFFCTYSYHQPLSDFANYYFGAKQFLTGANAWTNIYDVAAFNQYIIHQGYTGLFLSHTSVAPPSLLFYTPLSLIPDPYLAKFIFNCGGILFFSIVVYCSLKNKNITPLHLLLFLVVGCIPLYYNVLFGQTYLYIAAVLLLLVNGNNRWNHLTALLLAMVIAIKITPVIFLLYYFTKKEYRFLGYTSLYTLLILIVSTFFIGLETMQNFYLHILPKLMNGMVNDPFSSSYHSIIVILRSFFLYDELLNPSVIATLPFATIQLINAALVGVVLFFVLKTISHVQLSKTKALLVLVLFVNISSGYTSTYSLFLFLPLLMMNETKEAPLFYLVCILICALPPRLFNYFNPLLAHYKLYLFLALFISIAYKNWKTPMLYTASIVLAGFVFVSLLTYFSAQRIPVFQHYRATAIHQEYILNAEIQEGMLHYSYCDYSGYHTHTYTENALKKNNPIPSIANHTTIVFLADHTAIKPIGCFNEEVLFLSDYHRGPGLYAIFTLPKNEFIQLMKP